MAKGPFKMKGYSYPGTSPLQKDVKMWDREGNEMIVDDKNLGKSYYDDDLDLNWRDYNYKDSDGKNQHIQLFENKPGGSIKYDPLLPSDYVIKNKLPLA